MPKLIGYQKADSFNPLISWLKQYKPNVKYTLKAEFTKNGKEYEADCGAITNDPIISILYYILSNSIYSTGKGVTNPSVTVYTNTSGTTNVNASTSWLSTSYTLNGSTSGNFTLKFSTTMSSSVGSSATVSSLIIGFNYGQTTNATTGGTPYSFQFNINTQPSTTGSTACNVSVSSGTVVTWTLSGSVTESNTNATDSWYVYLWSEIWAELIAATGVSGAPTGLWQYPAAGTALFLGYSILLSGPSATTIGAYNNPGTSNTGISNISVSPGSSSGLSTAPSISFIFTPTSSTTLESAIASIVLNGSSPSTVYTQVSATGTLALGINNIGQSVTAGEQYNITLTDNVSVSGNT